LITLGVGTSGGLGCTLGLTAGTGIVTLALVSTASATAGRKFELLSMDGSDTMLKALGPSVYFGCWTYLS
jgi:hypothetical protein